MSGPSAEARLRWTDFPWRKIGIFLIALFLFILSIQLLKSGAKSLAPFVGGLAVQNAANALGFGWLFAYLVLSGSPVAATALTFFDAGAIDQLGAFAMIAGSRFGASFIVLALGFVYALRGHERRGSLAMGLLSLLVTFAVYVPALVVGYWLLRTGAFDQMRPNSAIGVISFIDVIFDPLVNFAEAYLPRFIIFLLGFGVLWYSLNLIDQALPNFKLQEGAFGGMARLLYRPIVTFMLGLAITSLTMSVSVSLSVLVPLSARGYIRRENVIPYIMGANITTFIDTLVAALLLNNPPAFTVVLVEMVSVALVSLVILLLLYQFYERALLHLVEVIGASHRNLTIFLLVIFGIPVALMFVR
jgi:sodium-dependent phosphate cotransporter